MDNNGIIGILDGYPRIRNILKNFILTKFNYDGYLNTSAFHKTEWVKPLYKKDTYEELNEVARITGKNNHQILNKIFTVIVHNYACTNVKDCNDIITWYIKDYIDNHFKVNSVLNKDDYYIYKPNIQLSRITSLESYIAFLSSLNISSKIDIFYRGQSDSNYVLLPSILRDAKWYEREKDFYNSITRLCPKDFNGLSNHIDHLVEMQHYELPTRLLDITKNALVAILFACIENPQLDGEVIIFSEECKKIRYGKSDLVSILSCLPSLTVEEQIDLVECSTKISDIDTFNREKVVQRLLHEIKTEKPAFKDIINPKDITRTVVALPALLNNRIIKQSGAFIITGLVKYEDASIISVQLNSMRYNSKGFLPICIIDAKSKKEIKRQLDMCDLNEATIFPEIDRVSRYLKSNLK